MFLTNCLNVVELNVRTCPFRGHLEGTLSYISYEIRRAVSKLNQHIYILQHLSV